MPSAANAKSEKPASSEAVDNSPIRQIMTILDHKIRNLEKRKGKLVSYRDLQKSGKELNGDQKVAVAKYDEVVQTLEFARELSKQVTGIAVSAEKDAKKQAKKEAWVRYSADTNKIREVLLILDCLMQMGSTEARDDFLNGTNGAAKLTEDDLKILDELYPEVTPKHEVTEEGQPGFHIHTAKAADHLYAIIDGKPKEVLGTTYAHIKEIVTTVHACGYFDKSDDIIAPLGEEAACVGEEQPQPVPALASPPPVPYRPAAVPGPAPLPVPPAATVVPAPAYPLHPHPPITLQEVEHAYFSQQYPQQIPISEVIGSQNFFFLQESEIDSPAGTPQPPPIMNQSPPGPIPTQTFTNQHFVRVGSPGALPLPPQPHFPPHPDHAAFAAVPLPPGAGALAPHVQVVSAPLPPPPMLPDRPPAPQPAQPEAKRAPTPVEDRNNDEWKESRSPEREDTGDRKTQGQGDGQNRFRRYGRGRGSSNGYRGRGGFQGRQGGDYHGRHGGDYQNRSGKDGYQSRQYNDNYQNRHGKEGYHNRAGNDGYYGNGDAETSQHQQQSENGQSYQGGFKSRGRGPRGPRAPRPARPGQATQPGQSPHYARKHDTNE